MIVVADMHAESRVEKPLPTYVPRDEQFEESKMNSFSNGRLKGTLHNLLPSIKANISADNHNFKGFSDIDSLYSEGLFLKLGLEDDLLKKLPLPKVVGKIQQSSQGDLLKYNTPKILSSKHSSDGSTLNGKIIQLTNFDNTKIHVVLKVKIILQRTMIVKVFGTFSSVKKKKSDFMGKLVILVTNK